MRRRSPGRVRQGAGSVSVFGRPSAGFPRHPGGNVKIRIANMRGLAIFCAVGWSALVEGGRNECCFVSMTNGSSDSTQSFD
jgi:hypothetical protein